MQVLGQIYASMGAAVPEFFKSLWSWEMLVAILIGLVGGMIIGALPGLNSLMGISIMLPFTYAMSPIPAMTMLMAIYTAAIAGGSLTAIMLHTPGTPANMATIISGYKLAERGEALSAMYTSLFASMIGSIISGFALMLIAPVLARVGILFDSPEYFAIALFGVGVIATLTEGKMVSGFAVGFFGMMISCIGVAPNSAVTRYHFGYIRLMNGLDTTAVVLGMFSISQALILIENINKKDAGKKLVEVEYTKRKFLSWSEIKRILPTTLRGSIVGIGCGILPGAGANIGGFLGYNDARSHAKDKEEFDKGCIEGVAGPEAANNAVTGGAMIPMMTLGIPGSSAAALLLGGMMIHGLQPGLSMFTNQGNLVFPMIFAFILVSVLILPVGMLLARAVSKLANIPSAILAPIIIVLSVLGAYSIRNSIFDVYVVTAFGLIGYFFRKADLPLSGFVLGMLLGNMAEMGLMRTRIIAKGDTLNYFLHRPICVILILLLIYTMVKTPVGKMIKKKKAENKEV